MLSTIGYLLWSFPSLHPLPGIFLRLFIKKSHSYFQTQPRFSLYRSAKTYSCIYTYPHSFLVPHPSANTNRLVTISSSIQLRCNFVPASLWLFVPISLCQIVTKSWQCSHLYSCLLSSIKFKILWNRNDAYSSLFPWKCLPPVPCYK